MTPVCLLYLVAYPIISFGSYELFVRHYERQIPSNPQPNKFLPSEFSWNEQINISENWRWSLIVWPGKG